ncbi:Na+/H+ antiporter NhaC [Psychrobium sp. MM17-31]|uniref:Na+/H+ antiporter NhaC n=1 Tax=Psychrobium sp. MM17-31 TaxID=2917758 RepID=UPI001EF552E0|nr:Na+/H+ antiporter NhaC [Psychrobium sp. MM17-31]MCG7532078.1 Na+/H+ antiporter NhaC [Psychrobium sp. MM17-31]
MTISTAPAKDASLLDALIPVISLVLMLSASVYLFGSDSSSGANQIALILAACIALAISVKNGHQWQALEQGITQSIASASGAFLILFAVGALIGTWLLSGTVPSMIYYGMKLLSPQYFYVASCVLCAVVALSIGSSWTVAGTLGIALIGIAGVLNLSVEITAGAIISGAYFGDKMSPLSDTTNLAPAVAGTDIFKHIKHMLWTTTPSILIALVIFYVIGINAEISGGSLGVETTLQLLEQNYDVGVHLLFPLLVVLVLAYRKMPAFPTIILGTIAGAICALVFQYDAIIKGVSDTTLLPAVAAIKGLWIAMFDGYVANTGDKDLDALLSRGGMSSILTTIWLIMCAMAFGGIMEVGGMLKRLLQSILSLVNGTTSLVLTTLATCIGTNIITSDQYIAIVLPGRMLKLEYEKYQLDTVNLSRAIEDSATITSPLVPWNTCGAYMAGALGVATFAYLPYAFFNLICPIVSAIYAIKQFKMMPLAPQDVVMAGKTH